MKIWIFVAIMNLFGTSHQGADGIKFAFKTKDSCEYAIAKSDGRLKCIEIELLQ